MAGSEAVTPSSPDTGVGLDNGMEKPVRTWPNPVGRPS